MSNDDICNIINVDTNSYMESCADSFDMYYNLLVEHSAKYNLTTIVEREEVYLKHFVDSMLGVDLLPNNAMLMDIGCGAGFPGLVLAVARPDIQVHLYDSVRKKINFCNIVIQTVGLSDRVQAIHSRVEDTQYKEFYDVAVVRAVSKLSTLLEYALPYLKVGGILLAYKSVHIDQELLDSTNALVKLNGSVLGVNRYRLDNDTLRTIVVIRKDKITEKKYPRKRDLPRTQPL